MPRASDRPQPPRTPPAHSSLRPPPRQPSSARRLSPLPPSGPRAPSGLLPPPPRSVRLLLPPPDAWTARIRPPPPPSTHRSMPDARCLERDTEVAKKRQACTADEEYERVVLDANTNRDDSIIEARSVEDFIAKMAIVAEPALLSDRHPERRLKVSYKAFEEAELARLKEEKPGLTLHQYKDMIWKLWKKSPESLNIEKLRLLHP